MADFYITKAFLTRAGMCSNIIAEFEKAFGEDGQINLAHPQTRELFEAWIDEMDNKSVAIDEQWLDIFRDFRNSVAAVEHFGYPEETETDEWLVTNPLNGETEYYHSAEEVKQRRIEIINEYMDTSNIVGISKKFINEDGDEVIRAEAWQDYV